YGLRRRASGVVHILAGRDLGNLSLDRLLDDCLQRLETDDWLQREQQQVKEELLHFFRLRLKTLLQEKGIRYDVIDAVLASDIAYPQLVLERAQVLTENVAKEEFKSVVEAFSRVANLSAKGDPEA